jgi:hypothetical protein
VAIEQPRERLLDLVGWIFPLELAEEIPEAPAAVSDRCRKRAIKLAVKKKLAVFGIEAHGIGWQQIDAEVRGKLRNVLAVAQRRTTLTAIARTSAARLYAIPNRRRVPVLHVVRALSSFCGASRQS